MNDDIGPRPPGAQMNYRIVFAVSIFAVLALAAQAQQRPDGRGPPPPKGPKPTPAEVQRVVASITADRAKLQAYCEMMKLDEQIAKAEESKDMKKAEALAKQADEISQKLGPEYASLMERLEQIDPSSPEGQRLSAAFEPLDKRCTGR
jgi:hypothetical protein